MRKTLVSTNPVPVLFAGIQCGLSLLVSLVAVSQAQLDIPANTWVKLSPLAGGPPSPRMGYEGDCAWNPEDRVLLRYGGHNQGGGGEQGSELWSFDPITRAWNLLDGLGSAPPGVCCAQQNIWDPVNHRYLRFPAASGSHGWQWFREVYLKDSSVWAYNARGSYTWYNLRPLPAPHIRYLRCTSWDHHHRKVLLFGGEGSREGTWAYDTQMNRWENRKPDQQPPFRSGGNMVYDVAAKKHVLFGSQFNNNPATWVYDYTANTWTKLACNALPPTDKNDAVMCYDSSAERILALIKISEGEGDAETHRLETWSLDTRKARWQKVNPDREPDASSNRARNLLYAPELGVALLENCTKPSSDRPREQQIWAFRFADSKPSETPYYKNRTGTPLTPFAPEVDVYVQSPTEVHIDYSFDLDTGVGWDLVYPKKVHIERAPVEVWSNDQLVRIKSVTPSLAKPSVGAIRRIGPFVRIKTGLSSNKMFRVDRSVDLRIPLSTIENPIYENPLHHEHLDPDGKPYGYAVYAYRVIGVDQQGIETGPSALAFTIPAAPFIQGARERDEACDIKWIGRTPQDESHTFTYRVYRMDGRWKKDPIRRLTDTPILAQSFTDTEAGTRTHRYYVVAVDALGQEGFPSAPLWYKREWAQFYRPFIEEWHE